MGISDKVNKLFNFICKNDVVSVRKYLEKGINPNEKNKDNCTMLYTAVEHRYIDIIKLLLDHGADPNIYSSDHMTPLHSVSVIIPIRKISKLITKYGNLVTLANYRNTFFVYNENRNLEIAKMLIQNGALVNMNNMKNITPLHIASSSGSYKMVELLLLHGANTNALTSYGETSLHYSVSSNDLNISELLIENGTNVNVANKDSITALIIAVEIMSIDLVRLLLDKGADTNAIGLERFKLYVTETKQNNNILKYLNTNNVNTNVTMINEYIASELYDWNRNSATSKLMFRSCFEPCTVPVTLATRKGSKELLEILLEYGCNPDICEKTTSTYAMHYAVIRKHYEMLNILIRYDAYTDVKDRQQNTPAHYAVKLPISESCKYLKLLKLAGASFNLTNRKGRTPLHTACKYNNTEAVKYLIESGCDTNIVDVMSFTPLNYAVYYEREDTVKILLESGCVDPNLCDYKEVSPIIQAIKRNNKNIIKMLLNAGIDIKPINECYGLHMLAALHNKDLLKWLLCTISELEVNGVDDHYVPLASYVAELSDIRIMEILIEKGLDLNKVTGPDETMFTMIFSATSDLRKSIIDLLISQIAADEEFSEGFKINKNMIQTDKYLLRVYHECKNQVSKMGEIKLGDGFTMIDIYKNRRSIHVNFLARYAMQLSTIDLREVPIYRKYLEILINPAIKRHKILNAAKDTMNNILHRKEKFYWNLLPVEIKFNILEYLNSKDLISLIHSNTVNEIDLSHIFI
ncbi:ankyrin repeat protein [Fowlpox virus]|uniref:Putative ankyrin repeat protein FPV222 n=2 Tax=Fowlpox virus TaxID=10261 RepID=V222_FOWPN|nr:ankyrin repeat protein [Fowlpox virus]Q9J513.1 RecName: Full=Putative ankyrin repeat protein FPV222 [Fowlpox virus strain NVSL]UNS14460.1 ALPV-296 [Albatrosspox virus]WPD91032.1 ankyrin repeat family protein [Avipoxvirus sp.]AAF44566.1 ORF FPV222 Ankyrin repeat gene family protein [Fowlpox virus]AYO89815.1 ankyrin repeat protein [Fowlpox virus]AYO90074.1 ankyrin repeat protein [Fowlpox virus]